MTTLQEHLQDAIDQEDEAEEAGETVTSTGSSTKLSLRGAINAACKECIYDDKGGAGSWRQQVEACTVFKCALYPVRPISKPRKAVDLPFTD